jgi:hypothetical protein
VIWHNEKKGKSELDAVGLEGRANHCMSSFLLYCK